MNGTSSGATDSQMAATLACTYLVCFFVLFNQHGQVLLEGLDDLYRGLVGFTKERHDVRTLASSAGEKRI